MRNVSRTGSFGSGALLVAAVLALMGGAAADSSDPGSPRIGESNQSHGIEMAVEDVAATTDRFAGLDGYSNVSLDYGSRTVTVHWKGKVPGELATMQGIVRDGISVQVLAAKYSAQDVEKAAERLFATRGTDGVPEVVRVAPNDDFSGIAVAIASDNRTVPEGQIPRGLRRVSDVPISSVIVRGPVKPRSRGNDASPWQGGGVVTSSTEYCTVGFPVLDGVNGRLLSAGHCDLSGNSVLVDGAGQTLSNGGAAVGRRATNDSLLIDPVGGTIGKVFGGPWNAGTTHSRYQFRVVAKSLPKEGTHVCISGAATGEHCNGVIDLTGVVVDCGNPGPELCHGFEVRSTNGSIIDGAGDSGAPVYFDRGDGTVGARGIMEAGVPGYQTSCPSNTRLPLSFGECDTRAMVIGYQFLEADWGVVIEFE